MAQIVLTVPDAMLSRVVTALSERGGYRATLSDGTANPQTRAQFAKQQIALFVRESVKLYEAEQARATNDIDVA